MPNDSKPTQNPPSEAAVLSGAEESKPVNLPLEEESSQVEMQPSAALMESSEIEETEITASVWNNSKKIVGLWSINQNRNSWIAVAGMGWKKLANNSDSAVVALTILGAHALQTGHIVNFREEDGQVKEIYAW